MSITRHTDGGGSFRGELDAEGLALLEAALAPLSAPLPATAEALTGAPRPAAAATP